MVLYPKLKFEPTLSKTIIIFSSFNINVLFEHKYLTPLKNIELIVNSIDNNITNAPESAVFEQNLSANAATCISKWMLITISNKTIDATFVSILLWYGGKPL